MDVFFEPDVYGLLMFRIVGTSHWLHNRNAKPVHPFQHYSRLLSSVFLYLVNVLMQGSVIVFLIDITEMAENKWESHTFKSEYNMTLSRVSQELFAAVRQGSRNVTFHGELVPLEGHSSIFSLCEEQLHVKFILVYYVMIFWWVVFMIKELKTIRSWFAVLFCRSVHGQSTVMDEDETLVRKTTRPVQILLILCGPVVKLCIAVPLTFVGAKFLLLQVSPLSLIMKVLALQLVIGLDDLLVSSLTTHTCHQELEQAKIHVVSRPAPTNAIQWDNGVGDVVWAILALLLTLLFTEILFGDIMQFRRACDAYDIKFHNAEGNTLYFGGGLSLGRRLGQAFTGLDIDL
jgi:hypothetical protein